MSQSDFQLEKSLKSFLLRNARHKSSPPNARYKGNLRIERIGFVFRDSIHQLCFFPVGEKWDTENIYRVKKEHIEMI